MADLLNPETKPGTPEKVTTAAIKAALRARFGGKGHQIFFEVGNDTGTRVTRHADAVSIGIWPSTGHAIHGFEIKISRTDWLKEKADPGKSLPVYRHCHRWSLVTPAGLVKPDELPPTWGLIAYRDGALREVVMPKRLEPEPLTPGFVAALVRRAGDVDGEIITEAVRRGYAEWNRDFEAKVAQAVKATVEVRRAGHDRAVKMIADLEEALGEPLNPWALKDLAAAIKLVKSAGIAKSYDSVQQICRDLERAHKTIRDALDTFGVECVEPRTLGDFAPK